jgi:hypothetical protein
VIYSANDSDLASDVSAKISLSQERFLLLAR